MGIKVGMDEAGKVKQMFTHDTILQLGRDSELFPLFTKADLAARWGQSVQVVGNWAKRHSDFPKPIIGLLANDLSGKRMGGGAGVGGLYPLYRIRAYEILRGIIADENIFDPK